MFQISGRTNQLLQKGISEAHYNPILDLKLLYPISKFNQNDIEDFETGDIAKVSSKLNEINKEFNAKTEQYDLYCDDYYRTAQEIQNQRQDLESFNVCIKLFEEQLTLNFNLQYESLAQNEISSMQEHHQKLRYKLSALFENRTELEKQLKKSTALHRLVDRDMNSIKPVLQQLGKRRVIIELNRSFKKRCLNV